ncbi:hypothetical protein C8J57DRAFT_1371921 [Mycena rebaudengoi]|nr:hypothetical protein C8J57DRAFT_1371921 [Mycena rebaudengoi]
MGDTDIIMGSPDIVVDDDIVMGNTDIAMDDTDTDTYYLGTIDVRNKGLLWRKIGGVNTLVTKESAEAEDARIAEIKARKALESQSRQLGSGTLLKAAPLTFVALLSTDGFRLVPDGNWKRPTIFAETFADVKLNGRATVPVGIPSFSDDFSTVLQNVEWFMTQTETAKYSKAGIFGGNESSGRSIRMRHVLFERTDAEAGKRSQSLVAAFFQCQLTYSPDPKEVKAMENWPVQSDQARAQVNKIKNTHRVLPLCACDRDNKVIPPEEYRETLRGAVVRARVSLKHWPIEGTEGGRDVYTADIEHLRVL